MGRLGTLAVAVLVLAVAGCIGADDDVDAASVDEDAVAIWHEQALPFGPDHDHTDPGDHRNLSTDNFDVIAYDPLFSDHYDGPAGAYFCGNAGPVEDDRRLAVTESRSDVAFALADVTDPAEPEWLGELVMQTTHVYDLAVVPDGEHVVLVTSDVRENQLDTLPDTGETRWDGFSWETPCSDEPVEPVWSAGPVAGETEDPVPRPMSVLLVDISDPEQPEIVEQQPLAGNGHSVYTNRIDGTDWALVTTTRVPALPTPGLDQNSISAYQFYRVTDTGGEAHLELVSAYKPPPDQEEDSQILGPRGHDGRMKIHPGTGALTAYLAGGDRFTTLDLSDPENPTELGRWTVEGPATPANEGTMHSAFPLEELWNGTHYTIIGPEHAGHPEGAPSGIIWVLDTTDPTEPEPVAAWTLPAQVDWNGTFQFSNHYVTVVDETLFVSMYHGGVWAVDLSPLAEGPPEADGVMPLESIGVLIPSEAPREEPAMDARWAPTIEEVERQPDGTIVTFSNEGLYTFSFDPEQPMSVPEPWDLTGAIADPVVEG